MLTPAEPYMHATPCTCDCKDPFSEAEPDFKSDVTNVVALRNAMLADQMIDFRYRINIQLCEGVEPLVSFWSPITAQERKQNKTLQHCLHGYQNMIIQAYIVFLKSDRSFEYSNRPEKALILAEFDFKNSLQCCNVHLVAAQPCSNAHIQLLG